MEKTWAATNREEYWAEGVQSYFNTNIGSALDGGMHNHINTRKDLAEYDPALYAFFAKVFQDFDWTTICPE